MTSLFSILLSGIILFIFDVKEHNLGMLWILILCSSLYLLIVILFLVNAKFPE